MILEVLSTTTLLHKCSPLITCSPTDMFIKFCCVYYSWILICLSSIINITLRTWIDFCRLYCLQQFEFQSKIEWKVQRFPIYFLPPLLFTSSTLNTFWTFLDLCFCSWCVCNLKCFLPLLFTNLTGLWSLRWTVSYSPTAKLSLFSFFSQVFSPHPVTLSLLL